MKADNNGKLPKKTKENKDEPFFVGKFTNQKAGQDDTNGWNSQGLKRCLKVLQKIKAAQDDPNNRDRIALLESKALEKVRLDKEIEDATAAEHRKNKRRRTRGLETVEVVNTWDDDGNLSDADDLADI